MLRNDLECSATGHELKFHGPSFTAVYIVSSCFEIFVKAVELVR